MKQFKVILAVVMASCLLLSLTACVVPMQTFLETVSGNEEESNSSVEEESTALEKLVNEFGDDWEEEAKNEYIDARVSASGNTATFSYTYFRQMDDTNNLLANNLEESLDENTEIFQTTANNLSQLVGEPLIVEVVYYNADGTELTSRTFYSQNN